MDHLLRGHAPLSAAAWDEIDREARERLAPLLAARRVVDWSGPHGWAWSGTDLGRSETIDGPEGAGGSRPHSASRRRVLPAAEARVAFTVSRREVADLDRGATDVDLDDLDLAARTIAEIENRAVFHGWSAAGFEGIGETSSHPPLALGADTATLPGTIARATEAMRRAGIGGPYGLAIGPDGYARILETTEGGSLLVDHLERVLGGSVLRAPGVDGALVASLRGGDFLVESGQDLAVGYTGHHADTVELYLEESFTFRNVEPDAAVVLS